jgi:ABC-type glycerol-3-phosphate transport system substrate-binding protein
MSAKVSRRQLLRGAGLAVAGAGMAALVGCQPKVVEVEKIVKETVVTTEEKIVKETVVTTEEKIVEVEKEKIVEKVRDVVIVRMHSRLGDGQRVVYDGRIEALQEDFPHIRVNVEEFPEGPATYGPKIVSLVAGGAVGDITWTAIGTGSFQFLAGNKAFAAIDDFVAVDDTIDMDDFYPRVLSGFRMGPNLEEGVGELFGLPTLTHGVQCILIFNRDLIEEAGVAPPEDDWTRDQLMDMAKQMTQGNVFGFLPATGDYSNLRNQTLPFGGEIISEDGTTSQLETPEVKQGLQWVWNCFYGDKVAPTAAQLTGGLNQMFLAKRLACYQTGGWGILIQNVVKDEFNWDMALMSKGPAGNRGAHLHADSFSMFQLSKNKPEAYEAIKYLTDKEAGVGYASLMGLACRYSVFEDPRIAENEMLVRIGQSTEEAVEHRGPANLRKQELQTTIGALFGPVWTGDEMLDDAFFAEASNELQIFLDKPFD